MQPDIKRTQTALHRPVFKTARAAGDDWRDVGAKLLKALQEDASGGGLSGTLAAQGYTTGILFITDVLTGDAQSLLHLLQDVSGIGIWTGCSGLGVFDGHGFDIGRPAAALMLANFPIEQLMPIPLQSGAEIHLPDTAKVWLERHGPPFGLVFADPFIDQSLNHLLNDMIKRTGGFLVGGMSSGRDHHQAQIGASATSGQLGGLLIGGENYVQTALTQGCQPMGEPHTITAARDTLISEIDDEPAISVFTADLRAMAMARIGEDPDAVLVEDVAPSEMMSQLDAKTQSFFQGDIHIGMVIPGNDKGEYVARAIAGIDPDSDHIVTLDAFTPGTVIRFLKRDPETVRHDLERMLDDLKRRMQDAPNPPRAALYVSCVARAPLGGEDSAELAQIREALPGLPLVGFFAGGEIFREQMHCYTGILTLFY